MLTIQYFTNILSNFRTHTILNHPDSHKLHFVQLLETRNTFLKPTTLYIAPHTPEILDLLGAHPPVNMILIYSDTISLEDISVLSSYAHNLILIENESMTTILNACLQTLSEYQDVQRTMIEIHQMVRSNKSMQDILDYAFQIFNNPIFVRDKYFRILGHTKNVVVDDPIWNTQIDGKNYQPYDTFKYLERNGIIQKSVTLNMPIYFKPENTEDQDTEEIRTLSIDERIQYTIKFYYDPNSMTRTPRLWCNILDKKKVIGQVILLESFRDFNEFDILYLNALTNALSQLLVRQSDVYDIKSSYTDTFITELLSNKDLDSLHIEEKQKYIQKDISGIKHVLVLTHPKNIFTDVSHNYIKGFFNDVFDTICCILFNEKIVAVVQSKKRLDEDAMQNLKSFLSDSGLISGISQPFSSFTDIKKCYNQAHAANRACNKQENGSLSFYSESALYHMLDICDQHTNLRDLCHPALFKLINYDTTYDTQYVPLLHAYIMSMKNKNALIKSMHLHRNTLYYRIKKIEEILECSLDDASTFFNLHLSFNILEYMGADHFSDH